MSESFIKLKCSLNIVLSTRPWRQIILFALPVALFLIIFIISFVGRPSQQFSELAQAFVHGQTNFLHSIGTYGQDPVLWHGKIYWDEGPLPALVLVPFVALFDLFHATFMQGYIDWFFILGVLFFVYKLARILGYSKEDSAVLTFGFALGSVFIGVAVVSSSWLFAQVITTFLLFWSLYEYFTRKRLWLLGTICGMILLTRGTAVLIIVFFGLELWHNIKSKPHKLPGFLALGLPVAIAVALIGLYNFIRFHNPFDGGYNHQLLLSSSAESRSLGIFSPIHIPTNFYSAFLRAPLPDLRTTTSWTLKFPYIKNNPYGMSIFITSPYLLYLFINKWRELDLRSKHLAIAILISTLAVFSYYGLGIEQFGYRYSLDFLPEVFLLFMILYRKKHKSISKGMKTLLLGSGIFNFLLIWSFVII